MSVKNKIFFILLFFVATYLGATYTIEHLILTPSFQQLENQEAIKDLQRCVRAIDRELDALETLCNDWAAWDDTYEYIAAPYKKYQEANLIPETFYDSNLNLIALYNRTGKVVWADAYDLQEKKSIELAVFSAKELPKDHFLLDHKKFPGAITGIMLTAKGPLLLASCPIITSEDQGPIRGTIIMGRFLGPAMLASISQQTRVKFSVSPLKAGGGQALPGHATKKGGAGGPWLETRGTTLLVSAVLHDIQGKSALILKAEIPREIAAQGRAVGGYVLVSITVAGVLLLLLLLVLMQYTVFSPLTKLTDHAKKMQQSLDLSARLNFKRSDEVGVLAKVFDGLIERLAIDRGKRQKAQNALKKSERRYRLLLESSPDPIVVFDSDGTVSYLNKAFEDAFGWTGRELIGSKPDFLPFEVAMSNGGVSAANPASRTPACLELEQRTKHGAILDVEVSSSLLQDGQGRPNGAMLILRDVTSEKQAQRQKALLEEQLRQSQKMEAVGTLAGGIAHDFNNILAAIMGYSELAEQKMKSKQDALSEVQKIINSTSRAHELVNGILTFSRKMEPELKTLDLNQEVRRTAELLRSTIPRMIDITLDLADNIGLITADPNQVTQVLVNLATNARDAMPEGGTLAISTSRVKVYDEFCHACAEHFSGEFVKLRVSDTGMGMAEDVARKIFDPFFTTKDIGKGTGLGMSVVFGIVAEHHGHIGLTSIPGEGTTINVFWPVSQASSLEVPHAPPAEEIALGNARILLVDDEDALLELGTNFLVSNGFEVLTAATGEEALEIYRSQGKEIDLVVLDMSMPGMGGHRCLQELLAMDPRVLVIISSGYALEGELQQTMSLGAAGFIAKPFKRIQFLSMIQKTLAQAGS